MVGVCNSWRRGRVCVVFKRRYLRRPRARTESAEDGLIANAFFAPYVWRGDASLCVALQRLRSVSVPSLTERHRLTDTTPL